MNIKFINILLYMSFESSERDISLHKKLQHIIDMYSNNEYVMSRLDTYMTQLLPEALHTANISHEEREEKKQNMNKKRKEFIERFMYKNKYYYCPVNKLFLHYDDIHFVGHGEDDIQHEILTTITKERNLTAWKHRINNEIMRNIRSRTPLYAIPESFTIQHTINMLIPNLFSSRYGAKHFLTLLGDNILGNGNKNIVYLITPVAKEIVQEIGYLWNMHFGPNNIVQNIKYKYHDHEYKNCRLIKINTDFILKDSTLSTFISKYIIDLLCVSTHYSQRYKTADNYLHNCSDTDLIEYVMYLAKRDNHTIVREFTSNCIEKCNGAKLETKNMIFIWKKFLKEKCLPSIMFMETLKHTLKTVIEYDEVQDCFLNITSTSLPLVSTFLSFWEDTYLHDDNENEIEIDELYVLFKKWSHKTTHNISETFILELIRHYYPSIEIENDKYLLNTSNKLWDKRSDVLNSLDAYKLHITENEKIPTLCSAYEFYIETSNKNQKKIYTVSKRYFEKITIEELGDKLDIDGIIHYSS